MAGGMTMGEFHLKNMLEYRQIKYKKNVIDAIISRLNYFDKPYTGVILEILNETAGEHFLKLYYESDYRANESKVSRRLSIFWTLTRSNLFKTIASDINLKTEKDFNYLFSVANFSFAEYIFRHNYSLFEISGGGFKDTVEALSASALKKKAEETYKKGHVEEAVEIFKQALNLTPNDFLILFQLGIYYFFEKADHIKAGDYFEKSAAGAAGIFPRLESMALCFLSLITRLKALHRGDSDLAKDALLICEKAAAAAPDFMMAQYCNLQAIAGLCAFEDRGRDFIKAAQRVFETDYNLLLQAILDNAFDPALEQLASIAGERYDTALASCVKMIEIVKLKISQMPSRLETTADTARVFHLQKEFKSAQEYFKKNKTCTDIEETIKRLQKTIEGADSILNSDRVQRLFIKFKEYSSGIVNEFKKDFGDRLKPYNDALKKRGALSAQIKSVYETYFALQRPAGSVLADDEDAGCESVNNPEAVHECLEKKYSGRNEKTLNLIKSRSCSIVFFGFESVVVFLWLAAGAFTFIDFIMITTVNLCLAPLYRIAGAEIFYFIMNIKLDELKREFSKLELKLDLSNNLPGEAEMKARDKYAKQIAGEFNISHIDARNVLEAALAGDYDKMKAIAKMICAI